MTYHVRVVFLDGVDRYLSPTGVTDVPERAMSYAQSSSAFDAVREFRARHHEAQADVWDDDDLERRVREDEE